MSVPQQLAPLLSLPLYTLPRDSPAALPREPSCACLAGPRRDNKVGKACWGLTIIVVLCTQKTGTHEGQPADLNQCVQQGGKRQIYGLWEGYELEQVQAQLSRARGELKMGEA